MSSAILTHTPVGTKSTTAPAAGPADVQYQIFVNLCHGLTVSMMLVSQTSLLL
jgi:hypothetical protein